MSLKFGIILPEPIGGVHFIVDNEEYCSPSTSLGE